MGQYGPEAGYKGRQIHAIETRLIERSDFYGKPLRRSLKGYRKFRLGDYRVVCFLDTMLGMWYLYLDESGDLGFDFVTKKPSKFFTVCAVIVRSTEANKRLQKAVLKTLSRKLNYRKNKSAELHGSKLSIEVKKYFYKQAKEINFEVYAITLNKVRVYERLTGKKEQLYNFIARQVIDAIPFEQARSTINITFDKCKSKPQIAEFNKYLANQLEGRIDPKNTLFIDHLESHASKGLQASDLFCNGIFRSYETKNNEWKSVYKSKIKFDKLYLPPKRK